MGDDGLWSLVAGSFEKFSSCCAVKYYDSEKPEKCSSLTYCELFQDSEVILGELLASSKKSPVGLLFPDDSPELVAVYPAIIATIRSVELHNEIHTSVLYRSLSINEEHFVRLAALLR